MPDQPLHWWYSFDNGTNWRAIPQAALVELDGNLRMVKVLVEQLEPQGHQGLGDGRGHRGRRHAAHRGGGGGLPGGLPAARGAVPPRGRRRARRSEPPRSVDVSLNRSRVPNTKDEILWIVIRNCSNALSFSAYQDFMDGVFSNPRFGQAAGSRSQAHAARTSTCRSTRSCSTASTAIACSRRRPSCS